MKTETTVFPIVTPHPRRSSTNQAAAVTYSDIEKQFIQILESDNFDGQVEANPGFFKLFEDAISEAIGKAFAPILSATQRRTTGSHLAHQFLQQVLYHLNQFNCNQQQSATILENWQQRIQDVWQRWELSNFNLEALKSVDVTRALRDRVTVDRDPPLSENARLFREQVTEAGYERLMAVLMPEALGIPHHILLSFSDKDAEIESLLLRLQQSEYGGDCLSHQRLTLFTKMLSALDMEPSLNLYLDWIPWEIFALMNQRYFLLTDQHHFFRLIGGFLYTDISTPARFRNYQAGAERLNLSNVTSYWQHYIAVGEQHGTAMLDEVVLPLAAQYPDRAWELVLGYDQQRVMSYRTQAAIARAVRAAERAKRASRQKVKV